MRTSIALLASLTAVALAAAVPASAGVTVTNVGGTTGLGMSSTKSWAADPADFNRDGRQDVLIVYHDRGAKLWRNDGGHLTAVQTFPATTIWPDGRPGNIDRHDCAWGDPNRDGLPDVYCTVGRTGLNIVKPANLDNELWLQQPGGSFQEAGTSWGVGDPFGRGRTAVFLDANGDGLPDLYVANETPRPQDPDRLTKGQNQLFLNVAGTHFVADPTNHFGLDGFIGYGKRAIAFDYNGDGWQDLLVTGAARPYLYVNNAGQGFTEIGMRAGLTVHYVDVAVADVTGDGRPDLIAETATSLLLRRRTDAGYAPAVTLASYPTGAFTSVAVGDVTGDRRLDVYAVRSAASSDLPDLLLVRNADGTWTRVSVPSTGGTGVAASMLRVVPWKADVLVLNGMPVAGTLQDLRILATTP